MRNRERGQGIRRLSLLVILFTCAPDCLKAADPTGEALVKQGDVKVTQHQHREALRIFRQADQLSPNNAEIHARISEQLSDLLDEVKSERLARESLEFALRATKEAPESSRAHVDLAIAYGKLTDYTDNKTKLEYSKLIKSESEKALDLDPKNALAAHVLGRWHEGIAEEFALNRLQFNWRANARLTKAGPNACYEVERHGCQCEREYQQ